MNIAQGSNPCQAFEGLQIYLWGRGSIFSLSDTVFFYTQKDIWSAPPFLYLFQQITSRVFQGDSMVLVGNHEWPQAMRHAVLLSENAVDAHLRRGKWNAVISNPLAMLSDS